MNGYQEFFKEKQPVSDDIFSRISQCEADIRENEVEINRISSDAVTLKQELISELDYRQSISNDRFAALEKTQSSAKSMDQVEMDNIWDQLEIVRKKVCNLFDTEVGTLLLLGKDWRILIFTPYTSKINVSTSLVFIFGPYIRDTLRLIISQ